MNKKELGYMKSVIDEIESDDPHLMVDSILGEMYFWFKKRYEEQTNRKRRIRYEEDNVQ